MKPSAYMGAVPPLFAGGTDAPLPGLVRNDHPATAHEAAASVATVGGAQRRRVLEHLQALGAGGATDEEMQIVLGLNPSAQRPRRVELVDAGLVRDSGRTRKTTSGRNAIVWEARP